MTFILNSNILITGFRTTYPEMVFPDLWSRLTRLVKKNRLLIHPWVRDEILKGQKSSPEVRWMQQQPHNHPNLDIPSPQLRPGMTVQNYYLDKLRGELHRRQPNFRAGAIDDFYDGADPFLVVSGYVLGGTMVTLEKSSPNVVRKVPLPEAAGYFGVECIDLPTMLEREGIVI